MKAFIRCMLLAALLIRAFFVEAQQTAELFSIPLKYLLYLPEGYKEDTVKKWPLLIFLHGSGESGDTLDKVKVHGPPKLVEQGRKFPFIVVSPQANINYGWQPEILEMFLKTLKSQLRIDRQRVYLTGLSMGGYGTWNWATKYPGEFAAIAPICGGGDTAEAARLKNIPIWCFHGEKDMAVPVERSKEMVKAARKYNSDVRLTLYPEAGHDSWTESYNNDSLYSWFLSHTKYRLKPVPVAEKILKDAQGVYVRGAGDSLRLTVAGGKLIAKTNADIELYPLGKDRFFIEEGDDQFEIRFFRDSKGSIDRFVFYADREVRFKKLK